MNDNGISIKSSEITIQEHLKRYYNALRDSKSFLISELFDSYRSFRPSLHPNNNQPQIDVGALCYCIPRLPNCIFKTKKIILCQNTDQLNKLGLNVTDWELVSAVARRREFFYDKITQTLIAVATSDSDIDDLINGLIAFQIERLKFQNLKPNDLNQLLNAESYKLLGITEKSDWDKVKNKFGPSWKEDLNSFSQYIDISIQSTIEDDAPYKSTASAWWQKICISSMVFEFSQAPIYFVSSNLHSFSNIIGAFVNQKQDQIISHIEKNYPNLYSDWQNLKNGQNDLRVIEFLYYVSSKYFSDLPKEQIAKTNFEESLGIRTIKSQSELRCNAQLIPVSSIAKSFYRDPNLIIRNQESLMNSKAYILNIDYPLGFAAYYLLENILTTLNNLKGVYIIGKAAILSGSVGDIQIPKIVFDERTNNIFYPKNIFSDYTPFTAIKSSILKDQKSISVYGTYLENITQLNNYIGSGFNIIEMESGPYLTAIFKHITNLVDIPHNTVAHLDSLPFDVGIINYASDNPLSQNLGEGSLAMKGIEPTYLAALSTTQRIIDLESV